MSKKAKNKTNNSLEEFKRFSSLLANIEDFVTHHEPLTYLEFDYYVVHHMTLFSIEPDFDFETLEITIQQIRKALPAIKRIFSKPIIILKDTDDVMPVENARIINQNTFLHLANHTHHVSNLTKRGVKPRKLLTRLYEDDYAIYENIIFCNLVDDILALVKKNRRTLDSLLYASNIMKFNLLEKANHVNYFLALGKLHTGYIRDFNQYLSLSKKMMHELSGISQVITPRLHKPVYRKNIKRNRRLSLKKTNIFLMQKDYRQVYKTYKYLLGNQNKKDEEMDTVDFESLIANYLRYVQILAIFAAGHFNFEMNPKMKIDMNALDITFTFKGWTLDISQNQHQETMLAFAKDKLYRILLTNRAYGPEELEKIKNNDRLDEVIVVHPFDEDYQERTDVFISMEDIDSFRRIQQILLKGMVYSDVKRETCPFCGGALHLDTKHGFYQCHDCMTQIKEDICEETDMPYYYTDITQHKRHVVDKPDVEYDEHWYYEKQVESLMYFRNITKINQNNEIICPHCRKVHKKT